MTEWKNESDQDYSEEIKNWSNKQKEKLEGSQGYVMKIGEGPAGVGLLDWYRGGHMNFYPMKSNLEEPNAVYEYYLKGYVPDQPFITKEMYVTSFGSCFAEYTRGWLDEHGYKTQGTLASKRIPIIYMAEGITNTYSLNEQFNWAYGNTNITGEHWIDRDKNYYIPLEEHRVATREIFDRTDVFILTCGLSEVWYDKISGEVYWRGIPKKTYNPERHGFKLVTVEENFSNLDKLVKTIKSKRPHAKIIFSLSPIPLMATFRDISCVSASMLSKATLRVAIDQIHTKYRDTGDVFYWPAFELVKEYCGNVYQEDNRHPSKPTIDFILGQFQKYFIVR